MKIELDYINGQTKLTDVAKLSSHEPFAGSRRIGRANLYERIDTIEELAKVCNTLKIRPIMLPVDAIKYSWAP